jgi:hypothetical protein
MSMTLVKYLGRRHLSSVVSAGQIENFRARGHRYGLGLARRSPWD